MNWFNSVDHMFLELCDWNFRFISQYLQVGFGPITEELLLYPKVWG